jgi:hypothetical protein
VAKPRDYTLTFPGAGVLPLQAKGRYIRILDTPVDDLYFTLDGGQELQRGAGQQIADSDPTGFTRLDVRSAVAQTVRFTVSDVPQDDSRSNVALSVTANVTGATALDALPLVAVPALSAQEIAAGNPDRVELRVALASDSPSHLWLGVSGSGDEEGGLLEPGIVDYIATTAAVFAYNPHPTDTVYVSVLDMESP